MEVYPDPMTDEELQVSLFSGQGRGGDEAKRSWMGIVDIMLILTLHISGIKYNSQLHTSSQTITEFHSPPLLSSRMN